MEEILVDGGKLRLQHFVQELQNLVVASHFSDCSRQTEMCYSAG